MLRVLGVLDFEARFCGFLQHHGLRLLVLIVGGLRFADVVHDFFGSFITYTLHAALQRYIDSGFRFSTILDTVLRFWAHFVSYPPMPPHIIVVLVVLT